jgi:hypothetical protein
MFINLSELFGLGRTRSGRSTEATLKRLADDPETGIVRASRRVTACCCDGEHNDGLVVAVRTAGRVLKSKEEGSPHPEAAVFVFAVDEHFGNEVVLSMDVESMERHVNNCTEALAYVRRRNEEMAAAAASD